MLSARHFVFWRLYFVFMRPRIYVVLISDQKSKWWNSDIAGNSKPHLLCGYRCFVLTHWNISSSECSFELHNHSSGVTCEWFSWPEDQSAACVPARASLVKYKGSRSRAEPPCGWPAAPRLTQTWTQRASTNTLLDDFKHGCQPWTSLPHMKDRDSSFIWARRLVWCNALTYVSTVHTRFSTIRLMSNILHHWTASTVQPSSNLDLNHKTWTTSFSSDNPWASNAMLLYNKDNVLNAHTAKDMKRGKGFLMIRLQQLIRGGYSSVNLRSKTFQSWGKVIFLT